MKLEFSRPFPVDKLRDHPAIEKIEATEEECEALAKRFSIVAIKNLEARLELQRTHAGTMVEVKGDFTADVVQTCVVSLEPFTKSILESIQSYFARPDTIPDAEDVNVEDDKSPEPIGKDGEIDMGELVAQHLALALDPYPRKEGVVFELTEAEKEAAKKPNPFAILGDLKGKKP